MADQSKYIESGGTLCPYCGSGDLERASPDLEKWQLHYFMFYRYGSFVTQRVLCNACEKAWKEYYTLTCYEPLD